MPILELVIYIVLFLICLVLSAFFASAETAYISLPKFRVQQMLDKNIPNAERVARIVARPERMLSTVLLGNGLINTAAASLGTALAITLLGPQGLILSTFVVTAFLLIFSETTPKTLATQHTERLALKYAPLMEFVGTLFSPVVFVLGWIATKLSLKMGGKPVARSLASPEEIRAMISLGRKEGTVEDQEARLLHSVFDFGDRPAREVMVPRPEVIALEEGSTLKDFLRIYTEHPLSRFPVYKDNMDTVAGILSVKDGLMALARGMSQDASIDQLMRPAYFAPESKRIQDLFREMQEKNYHMCVVVDEYGGTAGIISLSRLIEEIVGDVGDELADDNKDYEIINEHTFQIEGSMRIEEVNQEMDLDLPEGEYETVAGFILHLLGHIPRDNEQVRYKNLKISITEMRGPKIQQVLITREGHSSASTPSHTSTTKKQI